MLKVIRAQKGLQFISDENKFRKCLHLRRIISESVEEKLLPLLWSQERAVIQPISLKLLKGCSSFLFFSWAARYANVDALFLFLLRNFFQILENCKKHIFLGRYRFGIELSSTQDSIRLPKVWFSSTNFYVILELLCILCSIFNRFQRCEYESWWFSYFRFFALCSPFRRAGFKGRQVDSCQER